MVKKNLWGLIKTEKTDRYKKIYVFNLCVFKRKDYSKQLSSIQDNLCLIKDQISLNVQRALTVYHTHQKTFGGLKNKHQGDNIVLIGCGPSVNHLDMNFFSKMKNTYYLGLNRAVLFDKVKFDYLFTVDKAGLDIGNENYYQKFFDYPCLKFVGDQNLGANFQIPESEILKHSNIRRYKTTANYLSRKFAFDLETEALFNSCTVSIQAMQFVLYTNPQKIYLVGIDCNFLQAGHFIGADFDIQSREENLIDLDNEAVKDWKLLKKFAQTYYPETEIISVNPVNLKGIFHDIYTRGER